MSKSNNFSGKFIFDNNNTELSRLEKLCATYGKDHRVVFKSCVTEQGTQYLIVMMKSIGTRTNEKRKTVVCSSYAKFRADGLKVLLIVNIQNIFDQPISIRNTFKGSTIDYVVNKIAVADDYDPNIKNVCSRGIHYFKTLVAAYYYKRDVRINNLNQMLSGRNFYKWHNNGRIQLAGEWNPTTKMHFVTLWANKRNYKVSNGNITEKCIQHGLHRTWSQDKKIISETMYMNGKKIGLTYGHNNSVNNEIKENNIVKTLCYGNNDGGNHTNCVIIDDECGFVKHGGLITSGSNPCETTKKRMNGLWKEFDKNTGDITEGIYVNGIGIGIWTLKDRLNKVLQMFNIN